VTLLVEVCEAKGNGSANSKPSCCTVMSTAVSTDARAHNEEPQARDTLEPLLSIQ
jgi:hypothetical protein